MRILSIFTTFTNGGAEVLVANLSGAFAAAGHRSTVVALSAAASVGNDPATEAAMCERISAEGGEALELGDDARRRPVAGALALRRLVRRIQPDVIHAHTARALPLLWLARAPCPVVLTHHNSRLSFPPALFALFDRVADGYVAISHDCARLLRTRTRRPITRIVNAAGAGFLAPGPRDAIGDPITILAVGALSAQKNYSMLIEAANHLRHRCGARYRFRLQIAGDGALMPALRQHVAERRLGDVVELLGNRGDIAALMRGADIFVNSSHYEGMPIAMLEALQSALPVVATDVAGTRELILHRHNGLLARSDDDDALALALHELLTEPGIHRRFSAAALDTGRQYDLATCAGAHLRLYADLMQRRAYGPRATSAPRAALQKE
ncbi:glycosyltransferase [Sphingomonas koreensis]|nr:glycosyltransferase [Sphingomonas koreensis]